MVRGPRRRRADGTVGVRGGRAFEEAYVQGRHGSRLRVRGFKSPRLERLAMYGLQRVAVSQNAASVRVWVVWSWMPLGPVSDRLSGR